MSQSFMFITVMHELAHVNFSLTCIDLKLTERCLKTWLPYVFRGRKWWLNTYPVLAKQPLPCVSIGNGWPVTYGMCNLLEQKVYSPWSPTAYMAQNPGLRYWLTLEWWKWQHTEPRLESTLSVWIFIWLDPKCNWTFQNWKR